MKKSLARSSVALAALVLAASAAAQPEHGRREEADQGRRDGPPHGMQAPVQTAPPRAAIRPAEPHAGPSGYERLSEPRGWNARPSQIDRDAYQHNYQAPRSFRIGPYPPPPGWRRRHWVYGDVLPRPYWTASYILSDYWLFGLEVPPVGFEWVRVGPDALLIDVATGRVLQVEYGLFY